MSAVFVLFISIRFFFEHFYIHFIESTAQMQIALRKRKFDDLFFKLTENGITDFRPFFCQLFELNEKKLYFCTLKII